MKICKKISAALFITMLLYSAGVGWWHPHVLLERGAEIEERDLRTLNVLYYFLVTIFFLRYYKKVVILLLKEKTVLIFFLFAILSYIWSYSPYATFQFGRGLARATLLSVTFSSIFNSKEQINILWTTLFLGTTFSLLACLFFPQIGIDIYTGAWRGLFIHKNHLGAYMALSFLFFVNYLLYGSKYKLWSFIGLITSLFLAFKSDSSMSLFSVMMIVLVIPVINIIRNRKLKAKTIVLFLYFIALSLLFFFAALQIASILELTGKGLTLNGRTPLWNTLMSKGSENLFLGHGYAAFWPVKIQEVIRIHTWGPQHAHNGILDLWLQLGLVGVLAFFVFYFVLVKRILSAFTLNKSFLLENSIMLHFAIFFFLSSLTDTPKVLTLTIYWIIYNSFCLSTYSSCVLNRR